MHGFAFAIFYTLMGFPIGRLADRRHRVGIIAIGVALWSVMTAACGIARTFTHLFLARVGVGFGEAALNPAALRHSMAVVSERAAIAAALSLRWGLPHFRDSLDRALAWQRQV